MANPAEEKWAFISGSAGGIGRAIARELAGRGYCIYAHARRESEEQLAFLRDLEDRFGIETRGVYFDVTDTESVHAQLRLLLKEKKNLQVIVNNAGMMLAGLFLMTDLSELRQVFDVNFFSALEITQILLKPMIRRRKGSVINICSVTGEDLGPGQCAYGVSKAALAAFTRTLSTELRGYGIRVNAVSPGMTQTKMVLREDAAAARENIEKGKGPFDRMAAPEEIAQAVCFFAEDTASFVTGQVLRVDGGIHLYA